MGPFGHKNIGIISVCPPGRPGRALAPRPAHQEPGVDLGRDNQVRHVHALVDLVVAAAVGPVAQRGDAGVRGKEMHIRKPAADAELRPSTAHGSHGPGECRQHRLFVVHHAGIKANRLLASHGVTVSSGVAEFKSGQTVGVEELIQAADRDMYENKATKR